MMEATQIIDINIIEPEPNIRPNTIVAHLIVNKKIYNIYNSDNLIGRDPSNNICINDKTISAKHAIIEATKIGHIIYDLYSSNKTRIKNNILEPGVRYFIEDNAELYFANLQASYKYVKQNDYVDVPSSPVLVNKTIIDASDDDEDCFSQDLFKEKEETVEKPTQEIETQQQEPKSFKKFVKKRSFKSAIEDNFENPETQSKLELLCQTDEEIRNIFETPLKTISSDVSDPHVDTLFKITRNEPSSSRSNAEFESKLPLQLKNSPDLVINESDSDSSIYDLATQIDASDTKSQESVILVESNNEIITIPDSQIIVEQIPNESQRSDILVPHKVIESGFECYDAETQIQESDDSRTSSVYEVAPEVKFPDFDYNSEDLFDMNNCKQSNDLNISEMDTQLFSGTQERREFHEKAVTLICNANIKSEIQSPNRQDPDEDGTSKRDIKTESGFLNQDDIATQIISIKREEADTLRLEDCLTPNLNDLNDCQVYKKSETNNLRQSTENYDLNNSSQFHNICNADTLRLEDFLTQNLNDVDDCQVKKKPETNNLQHTRENPVLNTSPKLHNIKCEADTLLLEDCLTPNLNDADDCQVYKKTETSNLQKTRENQGLNRSNKLHNIKCKADTLLLEDCLTPNLNDVDDCQVYKRAETDNLQQTRENQGLNRSPKLHNIKCEADTLLLEDCLTPNLNDLNDCQVYKKTETNNSHQTRENQSLNRSPILHYIKCEADTLRLEDCLTPNLNDLNDCQVYKKTETNNLRQTRENQGLNRSLKLHNIKCKADTLLLEDCLTPNLNDVDDCQVYKRTETDNLQQTTENKALKPSPELHNIKCEADTLILEDCSTPNLNDLEDCQVYRIGGTNSIITEDEQVSTPPKTSHEQSIFETPPIENVEKKLESLFNSPGFEASQSIEKKLQQMHASPRETIDSLTVERNLKKMRESKKYIAEVNDFKVPTLNLSKRIKVEVRDEMEVLAMLSSQAIERKEKSPEPERVVLEMLSSQAIINLDSDDDDFQLIKKPSINKSYIAMSRLSIPIKEESEPSPIEPEHSNSDSRRLNKIKETPTMARTQIQKKTEPPQEKKKTKRTTTRRSQETAIPAVTRSRKRLNDMETTTPLTKKLKIADKHNSTPKMTAPVHDDNSHPIGKRRIAHNLNLDSITDAQTLGNRSTALRPLRTRANNDTNSAYSTRHNKSVHQAQIKEKVMFTGFQKQYLNPIVKRLGGEVVNDPLICTTVVTIDVKQSIKFLSGLARGCPIVMPSWLTDSENNGKFMDANNYILKDKQAEKKYKFNLRLSIEKARRTKLLEGLSFFVTKSALPTPKEMKIIIQAAGGTFLTYIPPEPEKKVFVITVQQDRIIWENFKKIKANLIFIKPENILTGILRQKFDGKQSIF